MDVYVKMAETKDDIILFSNKKCNALLLRAPGTGKYDKFFEDGVYNCAGCGIPLYKSTTKFNSGCGWPAFFEGFPGAINRTVSLSLSLSQVAPNF